MATATEAPASRTAEGTISHTQNQPYQEPTPEQQKILAQLREPFDDDQIQFRGEVQCQECKKPPTRDCDQHVIVFCERCQRWLSEKHICLAYISHGDATDRLLKVDPLWSWEPLALDERGLPRFDGHNGLWIRLTVGGMTRLGYGDAQERTGPNAVKETIGDAIRNAGMRFGMALDLWRRPPVKNGPFDTGQLRPEVRLRMLVEMAKARYDQADRLHQVLVWAEQEHFTEAVIDFNGVDTYFVPLLRTRLAQLEDESTHTTTNGSAAS